MPILADDVLDVVDAATLRMARRALPLDKRPGAAAAGVSEEARQRLARWQHEVDPAGKGLWEKRLAWDHLAEADLLAALDDEAAGGEGDAPAWLDLLAAAYGPGAPRRRVDLAEVCADPVLGAEVPFEEVFVPLVREARRRLRARVGAAGERFGPAAMVAVERGLLRRLGDVAGQALYGMFSPLRARQRATTLSLLLGGTVQHAASTTVYRSFVQYLLNDAMRAFFATYPVAARLCAVVTELWIDFAAEVITRLDRDVRALEDRFNASRPLGRVDACALDLGDVHDRGRAVLILTFESGCKVVYKPRPVGLETVFRRLVDWLNAGLDEPLHLYAPANLERDGYGWIEFIPHEPCADLGEVEAFYRKLGVALAAVYCLHGNDFHYENIIARGRYPVLIDMEALFAPRFDAAPVEPPVHAVQAAQRRQQQSVLGTGLLPIYKKVGNGAAIDMGGMGGSDEGEDALACAVWHHPNSDLMRLAYTLQQPEQKANLPVCDGQRHYAASYVEVIVDGFTRAYEVFARRGHAFLEALRPDLERQRVRFIFRATSLYHALLVRSCHPRHLRSGADRSLLFESLTRALLSWDEKPAVWALLAEERASLEQMDIPLFEVGCGSRDLVLSDGTRLPGVFAQTAIDACGARLAGLGDADLRLQQDLIRLTLTGRAAASLLPPAAARPAPDGPAETASSQEVADLPGFARRYALRVVEALERQQVGGDAPGAAWYGRYYDASIRRFIARSGLDLFSGNGGVALFAAAAWAATGDERAHRLAHAALRPLLEADGHEETRVLLGLHPARPRFGVGDGVGAALFACTHAARLLRDERYLDLALRLAHRVDPAHVEAGEALHAYGGLGGLILGLLPLYRATADEHVLRLAAAAGETVVRAAAAQQAGSAPAEQAFAAEGILLGPTGLMLALRRLHAVTADAACRELADTIAAREDERLGAAGEPSAAALSWVEGLAGVGMAWLDDPAPASEGRLRRVAAHLAPGGQPAACGPGPDGLARLAFLLGAADRLADPALRNAAEAALRAACARLRQHEDDGGDWGPGVFEPGLYQGQPGAAYLLLHLTGAAPGPCILSWQ